MNNFIAQDCCILCDKIIGIAIQQEMKDIPQKGVFSYSFCDKCLKKLKKKENLLD